MSGSAPPAVVGFQVNDGSAQRSMVDSVTLTFNEPVTMGVGALSLSETAAAHGSTPGASGFNVTTPDGGTTYVLSFPQSSFAADVGNSLPDGTYNLTVNAAAVTNAAGTALAGNVQEYFYRLFGDFQGIGEVTFGNGYVPIVQTFGQSLSSGTIPWYYDYNDSGTIGFSGVVAVAQVFQESLNPTISINPVVDASAQWALTLTAATTTFGNNGDPLSYQWTVTDPNGAAVALPGGGVTSVPNLTFTPSFVGAWSATVTVTDVGLGLSSSTAATSFYAFRPLYLLPSSNPALPAGMDTFTPPTIAPTVPGVGVPEFAASDLAAGPNQSLSVTGSYLSGANVSFAVYGQTSASNGSTTTAQIQDDSASGDILTISSAAPANSMYLVWPEAAGSSGISYGQPIELNNTDPTWIGPATAAPGQTVSVYGRNLSNGGTTAQSWVYIQPATGAGEWAAVTAVNPYKVDFVVPGDLVAGQSYQVWVNNGLGGQYSWGAGAGIADGVGGGGVPEPGALGYVNIKNGVTIGGVFYPGATGNGVTDDGPAIVNAINYLESLPAGTNGTLYFPTGTYLIGDEQVNLPSNVRVTGDGESKSTLLFTAPAAPTAQNPYPWPEEIGTPDGGYANVEFDNIGLVYAGPAVAGNSLVREQFDSDLTFNNVLFQSPNMLPLDLVGSTQVSVQNCTIIGGSSVQLQETSQVFLNYDNFYLANDAEEAVIVWAGNDISMTNCTVQDYNDADPATGMGQGIMVENGLVWGSIYNEYLGDNTTIQLGTNIVKSNQGPQVNIEGAQVCYDGTLTSAMCNSITLPGSGKLGIYPGDTVIVTAGTGLGQLETVKSINVNVAADLITLNLTGHWMIIPDGTSHVEVGTTMYNSVVYQNHFQIQATQYGANLDGSSGFEVWQGAYNLVADDNSVQNSYRGIMLASFGVNNPCYFITVINNTVDDSGMTAAFPQTEGFIDGVDFLPATPSGDANFIGVVVRGNTINSPLTAGIDVAQANVGGTATLAIVEQNTILNTPLAIQIGKDPDTLIDDNTFNDQASLLPGVTEILDDILGASAIFVGNTWLNFL